MPVYTYMCDSCETPFEKTLRMSEYADPQDCPECGVGPARKTVADVHFILPGDGWTGKNNRIKGQMAARRAQVGEREKVLMKEGPNTRLLPNVDGERTDSWKEASKLAASKGKDTTGYDKRAKSE